MTRPLRRRLARFVGCQNEYKTDSPCNRLWPDPPALPRTPRYAIQPITDSLVTGSWEVIRLGASLDYSRRSLARGKNGTSLLAPRETLEVWHLRDVTLRLALPHEWPSWDGLMNEHHELGFKQLL